MKNENSTVTKEGDKYSFEYNVDKFSKEDSNNEQENRNKWKKVIYMESKDMFQQK